MRKLPDLTPTRGHAAVLAARAEAEFRLLTAVAAVPTRYAIGHSEAMRVVDNACDALVDLLREDGMDPAQALLAMKAQFAMYPSLSQIDRDAAIMHCIAHYYAVDRRNSGPTRQSRTSSGTRRE